MSGSGRVGRDVSRCVEWSIDEYGAGGGFASTTIVIETCTSDAGSSRRSSKKSSSTIRRRRRKRLEQQQQMWLTCAEDDFFQPPVLRQSSSHVGKLRSAVKSPFVSGSSGTPYNKKLRKKNMQQQQQERHSQHFSFGATAGSTGVNAETTSSFFISPTHQAVAEATTPWDTAGETGSGRYQFFGHGGIPVSVPTTQAQRRSRPGSSDMAGATYNTNASNNNSNNNNNRYLSGRGLGDNVALAGGKSCVLAPLRSPSVLPPVQLLPASKADVCIDVLERCLLETHLDDDDEFSFS